MQLEGLDRHLRLIESYKKLHAARAKAVGLNQTRYTVLNNEKIKTHRYEIYGWVFILIILK